MASTSTDIANLALAMIGEPAITDIADDNQRAVTCKRLYALAAVDEQKRCNWPELKMIQRFEGLSLTALDGYAEQGWYEINVPGGLLRVLRDDALGSARCYVRIGNKWLFDRDDPLMLYTVAQTGDDDPAGWSPQLVDCVVQSLAYRIAMEIRQDSRDVWRTMREDLESLIRPKAHAEALSDDSRFAGMRSVKVARSLIQRDGGR